MPFYDLYMHNSHFYTAVTKDETKLYWWKIFCLQQDLQSSRKREIKKKKKFQWLEAESHQIHIRNRASILKKKVYIYWVFYLGLWKIFLHWENSSELEQWFEEYALCVVVEILYLKKISPGKSYSLCYRTDELKIIKPIHFAAQITEFIKSISFENNSRSSCHWWLSEFCLEAVSSLKSKFPTSVWP